MQVFKLRIDKKINDNVTITLFTGIKDQTLQNAGTFILRTGEYQSFAVALGLGADKINSNYKHIDVIFENEKNFGL